MDEAVIIRKALEGDLDAFSELISLYKKQIYNLCLRMLNNSAEAEDAAQEAFIKIYRSLKTYNNQNKFSTWAYKIASNTCIDFMRKRKAETVSIDDYEIKDDSSPEKHYIMQETRKEAMKAIEDLPEKYRVLIVYYHFLNLSYQEIANIINEPITIVKNRIYRARIMLRENIYKEEGEYHGLQDSI